MPANNLYISNSDKRPATPKLLIAKLWPLVVLVFAFLIGMDYVFHEYLVFQQSWSNQTKVQRLILNEHENEIPVFGASLARSSFMPDSISPDVYNYGMGKAVFDVTRVLMRIECAKDKTSPVIFEINPRTFVRNQKSTINTSTFIPSLDHPVIEEFMKESDMFNWHYKAPGMRYYGNYFEYAIVPLRRMKGEKSDNRGAMIESRIVKPEEIDIFVRRLENAKAKRQELLDKQNNPKKAFTPENAYTLHILNGMVYFSLDEDYFEEFAGYIANNRQRDFILVTVPGNPVLIDALPNFTEFTNFVNKFAESHPNVHYLDYSNYPTVLEDYKDPTHFSAEGARKFSSHFSKDFERITGIGKDGVRRMR